MKIKHFLIGTYFVSSLVLLSGANFEHPLTFLAVPNFLFAAFLLYSINSKDIKELE